MDNSRSGARRIVIQLAGSNRRVFAQCPFDRTSHLVLETFLAEAGSMPNDVGGGEADRLGARDRIRKRLRGLLREQHASNAIDDCFNGAAVTERDDGPAARHRFDRNDAKVLFTGEN